MRRELSPSEARKWLLGTLNKELPKVREQIRKGVERFVLVTNVSGTAHPELGSIDELQALLNEHIPIPAQAWWRDDIDRRLDDEFWMGLQSQYDLEAAEDRLSQRLDMVVAHSSE